MGRTLDPWTRLRKAEKTRLRKVCLQGAMNGWVQRCFQGCGRAPSGGSSFRLFRCSQYGELTNRSSGGSLFVEVFKDSDEECGISEASRSSARRLTTELLHLHGGGAERPEEPRLSRGAVRVTGVHELKPGKHVTNFLVSTI